MMPGRSGLPRYDLALAHSSRSSRRSDARAQDSVAQFYRGKQINLYIGTTPGRRL